MGERDELVSYFADIAERAGRATITAAEAEAVLDLAREVAHASERRYAPVAAYALGLVVGAADRTVRVEAVARRAISVVRSDGADESESTSMPRAGTTLGA